MSPFSRFLDLRLASVVVAARARFDQILKDLPNAEKFPGLIAPETNSRKAKRAAKPAEEDP